MATTNGKYGIRITYEKGPVGWIVGKDGDIMLFPDKNQMIGIAGIATQAQQSFRDGAGKCERAGSDADPRFFIYQGHPCVRQGHP